MNETLRKVLSAAACILMGIAIGTVIAVTSLTASYDTGTSPEIQQGAEKYTELMTLVDNFFIGEDVDMTYVEDVMASAVVSALGDRWSYYISAEDYQSYVDNINNSYVGVGITISALYDDEESLLGYEVTDVTAGGPAEEAGVLSGDLLIRVDNVSVQEISLSETKSLVQGEEGTAVELTFLRDGREITLTAVRSTVTTIPAEGKLLDGGVGYIIIDNFDAGCSETVQLLIEDLTAHGATSILFDVRENPGGLKSELTDLLDYLLPEGVIFHTINYAGEEEIVLSDSSCVSLPMAVLINENSYSAAEYFACALQEYGAAVVVGTRTCGKGYYQVGLTLSDGSCVNLSIGKYFTPDGHSLIDEGVTPDIEIPLDEEEMSLFELGILNEDDDVQLSAALACLQSQ